MMILDLFRSERRNCKIIFMYLCMAILNIHVKTDKFNESCGYDD